MNTTQDNDYPAIRAWCKQMGAYSYYTAAQVGLARATNAPQDAIYNRVDLEGKTTGWARIKDIKDLNKREDLRIFLDIQENLS